MNTICLPKIFETLSLGTCLFLLVIASCGSNISTSLFSTNEMVMSEGMVIEAINNNGSIKVQADKGMKRVVYIDNHRVDLDMIPRSKRWNGSLGAYCPGGGDPIHTVIEEGQQHFCSINEAMEWLDWQGNRLNYVYTSDGLVVGCEIHSDSNESNKSLRMQIWQFYINGEKPEKMHGAKDEKMNVFFKNGLSQNLPPIGEITPSRPKMINRYLYSGKVVDLMKEKKLSHSDIEKVINYGEMIRESHYLTYYAKGEKFDSFKDLYWVRLDENKRVVIFD